MRDTRHHPILPPYLLRAIARNGTSRQRENALRTLAVDHTFRTLRLPPGIGQQAPFARRTVVHAEKHRAIADAENRQTLPGRVVRTEGSKPTRDKCVDEAYDNLGRTWDLFWSAFARDSTDDEGLALEGTVHFGEAYNNAFWDGQRMVFGDGDGELFNRFTTPVEVVGHELAHGVVEDEGGLLYYFQSGALNESFADVFGSLVKQFHRGESVERADWLIGTGLFTSHVHGVALRSLKAPGTAFDDPILGRDPQPAHMDGFVKTYDDSGGVHINSGIPNRAFYLAAMAIGGYAWHVPGRIWYEALRDPQLRPNTGFRRFARLTVTTAERLYGNESLAADAVRDAWLEVGLDVAAEHVRVA